MSRSEVLARAEDDNGYWAMVGQREEFTTFTGHNTASCEYSHHNK